MWIENTNSATRRVKPPWADDPIEFSENGKAQVTRDVGERLLDEYPTLRVPSDDESSASDGDETDAEPTDDTDTDTDTE